MNNKKTITPIDAWVSSSASYRGKYINEQGLGLAGMYRRDYKKSSQMLVINNGNVLCRYKYPKVEHLFDNPMIRWQNLYFCGGYSVLAEDGQCTGSNDLLIEAVIDGVKPIGFIVVKESESYKYIKKAVDNGIKYSVNLHFMDGYCEIGLANSGSLKEHFNFDNLIEAYDLFSDVLEYDLISQDDKEWLSQMFSLELSDFICGFDYAYSGKRNCENVLTGLILGYPIESTVALMDYNIS